MIVPGILLTSATSVFPQNWTLTSAPITNWTSVASSANGNQLVATGSASWNGAVGLVYTSTNSGETWMPTSAPSSNWIAVASSADGRHLLAADRDFDDSGPVYFSTNYGATWSDAGAPYYAWVIAAASADGNTLAVGSASIVGGWIFISTNRGTTWTPANVGNSQWRGIASSADGQKLVVVGSTGGHFNGSSVATSTNGGVTWVSADETGSAHLWQSVASSAEGTKLVAGTAFGIYTSRDFGVTWIPASATVGGSWYSVASSADGTRLVAVSANEGTIYASINSGLNWTPFSPAIGWGSVASSADGCKLVATGNGGIYTWQTTPTPVLSLTPSDSSFLISWIVPSMPFVLQENLDLTTTNWTDVTTTPILNFTNLHHEVSVPLSSTNRFYRLKSL